MEDGRLAGVGWEKWDKTASKLLRSSAVAGTGNGAVPGACMSGLGRDLFLILVDVSGCLSVDGHDLVEKKI